jgi:hypothetical protein
MYAIEFEADVKNLSVKIPMEFKELDSRHIKLIALYSPSKEESAGETFQTMRKRALAFGKERRTFPLNWNCRKISREKMNER